MGGSENFTSEAGVRSGSGLPSDPYIISDWDIVTNSSVGIHIKDTNSSFTIRNVLVQRTNSTGESEGIYLENAQNGLVEDVKVYNFFYGVNLLLGSRNAVESSSLWNNTYGMQITDTNDLISGNHLYNNTRYGVYVTGSISSKFIGNNVFKSNNASSNGRCGSCDGGGFFVAASSNNLFYNNTMANNFPFGFKSIFSTNNTFANNYLAGSQFGLMLSQTTIGSQIIRNNITRNNVGVALEFGVIGNNVSANRITSSTYGVYVVNGSRNMIYNNYLQNSINAFDDWNYASGITPNAWNTTKSVDTNILGGPFLGGNFYSDYAGGDLDGDGIGDTPFSIQGGMVSHPSQDLSPLVTTQPASTFHDIAVQSVNVQPITARAGTKINVTVTTSNRGTVAESFYVSVTYSPQSSPQVEGTIRTTLVADLPPLSSSTFMISWSTVAAAGTYLLRTNATIVAGETFTANNISPATLVILTSNLPPVAQFTVNNPHPYAGELIMTNATASYDPDGAVTSYAWNFGDDTPSTTATTPIASHAYASPGNYTITLTVMDNEGGISGPYTKVLVVASNRPGTPTNFQLTASGGKTTMMWTAPSDSGGSVITKYSIYRASSASGPWINIANTTDTSYTDTTAANGQAYYYQVTATNQAGFASPPSSSQYILVPSGISNNENDQQLWLAIAGSITAAIVLGLLVIRRRRGVHQTS